MRPWPPVCRGLYHPIFRQTIAILPVGLNRNFDLRRDFHERLDKAPIKSTSIFNGAFAEILTYNIPILDFKKNMVGFWGDARLAARFYNDG